ncbi:MAG: 3-phosphoshikimate 1-carboxyvinyltransferase [Thermodesulfobacteriota bacterium]|nr:3-phosphoshikimate 1-carboxyvinyltransferase [Thermodesulfobacteriota bacterium]
MDKVTITKRKGLQGEVTVPGDKSISHRSIILSSIAQGYSTIKNFGMGEDNKKTLMILKKMGVKIEQKNGLLKVHGNGLHSLKEPENVLDAGNSGTTMRLISGLLSGQQFFSVITGDRYLRKRPMERIVVPLRTMGAQIQGRGNGEFAPLAINGINLTAIQYHSPIASAQVKSAILLAGLYAQGETKVIEPTKSRDHTERMLSYFDVPLEIKNQEVSVTGRHDFFGRDIEIPGDISSAAFLIVASLLTPQSSLLIKDVGINPTRTGIIDVVKNMGGNVRIDNTRNLSGEPVGDILVKSSHLKGITIGGEIIPRCIDEIPVIAVAAASAEGETIIKDARELRVKETDRIKALVEELPKFGVCIEEMEDGIRIVGQSQLKVSDTLKSHGDHRMAMALVVAGLTANGSTHIEGASAIHISYPDFLKTLERISRQT